MKNMLRAFTVLLLFFNCNNLRAQGHQADSAVTVGYTPFMLQHSQWSYGAYTGDLSGYCVDNCNAPFNLVSPSTIYYWTNGDTLVNNLGYTKIYTNSQSYNYECEVGFQGFCDPVLISVTGSADETSGNLCALLRQDTLARRVYRLFEPQSGVLTESLLYDFSLNVGDSVSYGYPPNIYGVINSIDSFVTGSFTLRRFNFGNSTNVNRGSYIEGIGSTADLFNPPGPNRLICFANNGASLYPSYSPDTCGYAALFYTSITEVNEPKLVSLSPNPTNDNCTLQLTGTGVYSATVIDITGRELLPLFVNPQFSSFTFSTAGLSSGLYFVRVTDATGKSSVVKLVRE